MEDISETQRKGEGIVDETSNHSSFASDSFQKELNKVMMEADRLYQDKIEQTKKVEPSLKETNLETNFSGSQELLESQYRVENSLKVVEDSQIHISTDDSPTCYQESQISGQSQVSGKRKYELIVPESSEEEHVSLEKAPSGELSHLIQKFLHNPKQKKMGSSGDLSSIFLKGKAK